MADYKVTNFNGRGRAELVRLIFAVAGQKFTDERFEFTEWPSHKAVKSTLIDLLDSPLGQLPYLTVGGLKLPQSISIARFVAKKFNLYGSNDIEQAKTDAVVDTVNDLQNAYMKKVFSVKEEERESAKKTFVAEEAAAHLEKIEKLIKLWGSNGHSVGSSLKWSDLFVFSFTYELKAVNASVLAKYPGILAVNKSVESIPKVAEHIKNRPVTSF